MQIPQGSKTLFDYPKAPLDENEWPIATILSICFIGLWILLITILKIMTSSSNKHFSNNKYDLVIFKPSQKNSGNTSRKLFENNTVLKHNIKALSDSGFDISNIPVSVNYHRKFSITSFYSNKF